MINIQKALSRETGSFFKVAWELVINAIAGKWGEVKAILPSGKKEVVRVAKGNFTHFFKLEDYQGSEYIIEESGASLLAIVVDEQANTTRCYEGVGKINLPLTLGKTYFIVVFGVL